MFPTLPRVNGSNPKAAQLWDEIRSADGVVREPYRSLLAQFDALPTRAIRGMEDNLEASLREMGVTFQMNPGRPWQTKPWVCDLLPHVFTSEEWETVERGIGQRLKAFDRFLADIYGPKQILRDRVLPVPPVLGSPYYQPIAGGLCPAGGAFLHLCGVSLTREPGGRLAVKHHYLSHASGISYMLQNRRALARVNPSMFGELPLELISHAPTAILEQLKSLALEFGEEPLVVLLTPGVGSAVYSEHTLLARRMGVPLVVGGDLVVLGDRVFLKTVAGLERVHVIYTRVADQWLDPMVFRSDSLLGVPGLIHCLLKGNIAVVNTPGSQLADDRALLEWSGAIIRYYLGESPLLPTLQTRWMGDLDACEMVFDTPGDSVIRPRYGERILGRDGLALGELESGEREALRREVFANPQAYVAQSSLEQARTWCFKRGRPVECLQDHIVFALRAGEGFQVFQGALTRVSAPGGRLTANELGGGSKDTWVLTRHTHPESFHVRNRRNVEATPPSRQVTSRVAESFYWLGRYFERAQNLCYMIGVIETLETEELNSAERRLYRPIWNRLLPPLERAEGGSRRSIANWQGRHRLVLDAEEAGSAAFTLGMGFTNADVLQDVISPEAWSVLTALRAALGRCRFKTGTREAPARRDTRRIADAVTARVPQFFETSRSSMLADDGWRFCEIGMMLERATITANAVMSMGETLAVRSGESPAFTASLEIELSAFLRLLGSRDAYRRIFQMRAAPAEVLTILWQHPESPRSVFHCIDRCRALLRESLPDDRLTQSVAMRSLQAHLVRIAGIDWHRFFPPPVEEELETGVQSLFLGGDSSGSNDSGRLLVALLKELMSATFDIHHVITDAFLSHQEIIGRSGEPGLPGLG